jgi:hypothetical protein
MKVRDFPYGKITKKLQEAVKWLNKNRKRIEKNYCQDYPFDFPIYWDMPKTIAHKLTSDEVDWIQSETCHWNFQLSEKEYNEKLKIIMNEDFSNKGEVNGIIWW